MKLKVFIHAQYSEWDKTYEFRAWGHDMTGQTACGPLIETTEVEFTPPPHEVLIKGTIEAYRAEQKHVAAEAERMHNEIQGRIDDLLCLEYKPEPVSHD